MSEGCLGVFEDICWCLLVSLDVWGGVLVDLGDTFGMPELLGGVQGCFWRLTP